MSSSSVVPKVASVLTWMVEAMESKGIDAWCSTTGTAVWPSPAVLSFILALVESSTLQNTTGWQPYSWKWEYMNSHRGYFFQS